MSDFQLFKVVKIVENVRDVNKLKHLNTTLCFYPLKNLPRFRSFVDMDIQAEKNELAKLILSTNDAKLVTKIRALFKNDDENWWDKLPAQAKAEINESINEADREDFIFFNEMKQEVNILLAK